MAILSIDVVFSLQGRTCHVFPACLDSDIELYGYVPLNFSAQFGCLGHGSL